MPPIGWRVIATVLSQLFEKQQTPPQRPVALRCTQAR